MRYGRGEWGRKDAFPGADGSTITQENMSGNATVCKIYGGNGAELSEDIEGFKKVDITTIIGENANTFKYTVLNPLTFIYNVAVPNDWYTTVDDNQNDTLWGDNADKSAYDPCPRGWRIAPNGTWNDFSRTEDASQPLSGTFPYYIKGVIQEDGKTGDFHQTNGRLYKGASSGTGTPLAWYPSAGVLAPAIGAIRYAGAGGYIWQSTVSQTNAIGLLFYLSNTMNNGIRARGYAFSIRCVQE